MRRRLFGASGVGVGERCGGGGRAGGGVGGGAPARKATRPVSRATRAAALSAPRRGRRLSGGRAAAADIVARAAPRCAVAAATPAGVARADDGGADHAANALRPRTHGGGVAARQRPVFDAVRCPRPTDAVRRGATGPQSAAQVAAAGVCGARRRHRLWGVSAAAPICRSNTRYQSMAHALVAGGRRGAPAATRLPSQPAGDAVSVGWQYRQGGCARGVDGGGACADDFGGGDVFGLFGRGGGAVASAGCRRLCGRAHRRTRCCAAGAGADAGGSGHGVLAHAAARPTVYRAVVPAERGAAAAVPVRRGPWRRLHRVRLGAGASAGVYAVGEGVAAAPGAAGRGARIRGAVVAYGAVVARVLRYRLSAGGESGGRAPISRHRCRAHAAVDGVGRARAGNAEECAVGDGVQRVVAAAVSVGQ
eukprot:ctg_3428.g629